MEKILPKNSLKRKLSAEDIGGKGLNLFKLAKLSKKYGYNVPDFFIIPVNYSGPNGNILLRARYLNGNGNYAVRSSSPYEDSQQHSFAGVFETLLDVPRSDLVDAIRVVKVSATSEKAQHYAYERKLTLEDKMAVIVQRMVEPELAGVIYSTLSSYPIATSIEFCAGSGKGVVDRTSKKIEIHDFDKKNLHEIFGSEKTVELWKAKHLHNFTIDIKNNGYDMRDSVKLSQRLEEQFGFPLDIEFAWTYHRGRGYLHLLQARAITDIQPFQKIEIPKVPRKDVLVRAEIVRGIGEFQGPVVIYDRRISSQGLSDGVEDELRQLDSQFPNGYALFVPHFFGTYVDCDIPTPNKRVLVEYGNSARSSHALTVVREKGVLYMGSSFYLNDEFNKLEDCLLRKINNGDQVRIVMDGREGLAYKVRDEKNPLPVDSY